MVTLLVGRPEKHAGLDEVAKPLCPTVHIFPFLPQVVFPRKFIINVHGVFPTRSQHWKLMQCSNDFHFALVAHSDNGVILWSTQLVQCSI